jgi:cupin fold WbuC family metalloprotein
MKGMTEIVKDGEIFALVLRKEFSRPGPHFFTPGEFSQQLGLLVHPKGRVVKRHRHKLVKREIFRTQEVLVLLEGKIRVELFDDDGAKLKSVRMKGGDSILLARGGHKVTVLENAKIIEVKQGPYAGFDDKEFF